MNINKLKGLIREKCGTQESYAKMIDISPTTLWERFKNPNTFKLDEIDITKKEFNLSDSELLEIFFTK